MSPGSGWEHAVPLRFLGMATPVGSFCPLWMESVSPVASCPPGVHTGVALEADTLGNNIFLPGQPQTLPMLCKELSDMVVILLQAEICLVFDF